MTVAALEPDLIVAIAAPLPLEELLEAFPADRIGLEPSPFARRKSPARRRAFRQTSFEAALGGAETWTAAAGEVAFVPAPPLRFEGGGRPVCALAAADGEDQEIGLLIEAGREELVFHARRPSRPVALARLGEMWADPGETGWVLRERLSPAWRDAAA
jgi:hypothetical protein